ncbi:cytochrome c oxidase assembly protein [Aneurinibacillus sp. REN35]|uniref:cytochrome c oxidase assembly protein n=1 Tax=Aneurinibacillus sp. REN35 TaxID=3237286 RepID=UPI0035294E96
MNNDHIHHSSGASLELILALPFVLALIFYIGAVIISNRHHKKWPLYRTICWVCGVICAALVFVGPLAARAHVDFTAHMLGHLFLGMLAPLLMALAAPVTLFLRTSNVNVARRFTRVLKSWPIRMYTHPIIASLLNIGGLWLLYTTNLYAAMQQSFLLHIVVHVHVFFAGYLFTVSMIYIDPTPHRFHFVYRAIVFIIALAGHGILSKYIYAYPPPGVSAAQAEMGGMLMYYGGDAIDLVLITILCFQWFKAARPRPSLSTVLK